MNDLHLAPLWFRPLPLGQVKPLGWLKAQLQLQANSLSGTLDEFWPDVKDSAWFGGDADAWERAPYWLDGLVPLAFVLDDARLKEKAARYVGYILAHQHDDGFLGPKPAEGAPAHHFDIWPQFLAVKMLIQYHEATGDERVVEAVARNLRWLDESLDRQPLERWALYRWFEALIGIYWLHEITQEQWLLELAVKLHAQGFNWAAFFENYPLTGRTPTGRWNYMGHVVNNAMAVKAHGLWQRLSGDERDCAAIYDMLDKHARYHGTVTGVITGDECIAGLSPIQGTELCAVIEYMYSLELLISTLGDPAWGDQLERIAFNALPATFSPDMLAHQYDQQVNQVECSVLEGRCWTTNDPDANIFGLEPHFGCCLANLSQGWPKFAAHTWMQTADGGLAAVAYAPSAVTCRIAGTDVRVDLQTDYPFRQTLHFRISAAEPVEFPLLLRIPAWAAGAAIHLSRPEGPRSVVMPQPGAFHTIRRIWCDGDEVTLTLPMTPRLEPRPGQTAAVVRGPLVYALKIDEEWRRVHEDHPLRQLPHADWEVYPATPWNYALLLRQDAPVLDAVFSEHPVGEMPFSPQGAPVTATAPGVRLPRWEMCCGSAGEVTPDALAVRGESELLTLIPYGCSNLRLTEFPVLPQT